MKPLTTKKLSFLALAERLIADRDMRRPLERIFTIMRQRHAAWIDTHFDLQNESYFDTAYPAVSAECRELRDAGGSVSIDQITFFDASSHITQRRPSPSRKNHGIIGSCIIVHVERPRQTRRSFVFEAVVATPTDTDTTAGEHIYGASLCVITVRGRPYEIRSVYYCQQDGVRSVCAHASLKTAIWYASGSGEEDDESASWYQPSTAVMNAIAKKFSTTPELWEPAQGLNETQCRAICRHFGHDLLSFSFDRSNAHVQPYELAYTLAQSRIPTIVTFKPTDVETDIEHMVPVLGHTLNPDDWKPLALGYYTRIPSTSLRSFPSDYLPSVEWVPYLLIHDDLLGPFFSLSADSLTRKPDQKLDFCGHITNVWAVVNKGFPRDSSPIVAQNLARIQLKSLFKAFGSLAPDEWRPRIEQRWSGSKRHQAANVVLRTTLITKAEYIDHLATAVDHMGNDSGLTSRQRRAIESVFPSFGSAWMVEFTLPELFSGNFGKLGEILLPLKTVTSMDRLPRAGQRIPSPILYRQFGDVFGSFREGDFDERHLRLGFHSHIPMFHKPADLLT